jgi:hypothetical protein
MKLKWLTNGSKDCKKDYFCRSQEELEYYHEWLKDKVIGEPKASDTYTVEDLKKIGMIGIYIKE